MIEGLAEVDEHLMEKYVASAPVSAAELKAAVRKGTIAMKLFPVICGASFKNKGVQPLLDAVRSEEHTSELQSPCNIVCRLLLEKKKPPPRPTETFACQGSPARRDYGRTPRLSY